MILRVLLTLSIFSSSFIFAADAFDPLSYLPTAKEMHSVNYRERIATEAALDKKYPGCKNNEKSEGGLLQGIQLQTRWQYSTMRHSSDLWQIPNYWLSIYPSLVENSFKVLRHATCDSVIDATVKEACVSWKRYFAVKLNPPPLCSSQPGIFISQLLWKAHTASLNVALIKYWRELDAAKESLPQKEVDFWSGWIRFVDVVAHLNMESTVEKSALLLKLTMPSCFPLGEKTCDQYLLHLQLHEALASSTAALIEEAFSLHDSVTGELADFLYRVYHGNE